MTEYDAAKRLAKAAGRAKSDVANKLVAMALYQLSHQVESDLTVRGLAYQEAVRAEFGNRCPYCGDQLVQAYTVLEHLDAMNQHRAGLHVPGNVLPACRWCNLEKRRDDQDEELQSNTQGWARFLGHDSSNCPNGCKTCMYWIGKWPDLSHEERWAKLRHHVAKIHAFRERFLPQKAKGLSATIAPLLRDFYERAQSYAEMQTIELIQKISTIHPSS